MNFRIIQSSSIGEDLRNASAQNFEAYTVYLAAIRYQLPSSAYEFATADWHYDPQDPKCPHDAWIQEIKIKEIAEGERAEIRSTQIEIFLLGAYHDRLLKLTYFGVESYSMSAAKSSHNDWITDEIRLSGDGFVVHEAEFSSGARLVIECRDLRFEECLTDSPYTARWPD